MVFSQFIREPLLERAIGSSEMLKTFISFLEERHRTQSIYSRYAIADQVALKEGADKLAALQEMERISEGVGSGLIRG